VHCELQYDEKDTVEMLPKIFHDLLDFTVLNLFLTFEKHGRYIHLQFCVCIIQKLFEKYGGSTFSETLSVIAIRILAPDSSGRYIGKYFPDVNSPTGTRKHAT
jgi:hypothetical protein